MTGQPHRSQSQRVHRYERGLPSSPVPLPQGPPPPLPGFAPMGSGFQGLDQSARGRMVMTQKALQMRIAMSSLPTADRWSTNPADNLTPETITRCRREAESGYPWRWADLCEQLLQRNGYLKSFNNFRRAWVHQVPWNVQPPPHFQDDPLAKKIAAFQSAVLNGLRPCWADAMNNLLSAPAFGYAACEQFWDFRNYTFKVDGEEYTVEDGLVPVWLEHVHQKRFIFQQDFDTPMLWSGQGGGGMRWPEGKFIWHRCLGDGITERRGFMTAAAWIEYALQAAWRDLIIYMHLYGIPQFALMVEKEILDQDEERAILDQGLQDYGQGMIPYFLKEAEIAPLGQVQGAGDALHPQVIQLGRSMLSVIITGSELAQTQGDGTGSYNAGQTHATTSHIYCVPDGTSLANAVESCTLQTTIARNVDQLCRAFKATPDAVRQRSAQFGWRAVSPAPTAKEQLEIYQGLVAMRFPASMTEMAQRLGVAIGQGNDIVKGEPVTLQEGAKTVSAQDAADGAEGNAKPEPERRSFEMAQGWNESDHPRADDGKFGSGGGGARVAKPHTAGKTLPPSFSSSGDAEKWAKQRWSHMNVDLTGMHPEACHAAISALHEFDVAAPDAVKGLKHFGVAQFEGGKEGAHWDSGTGACANQNGVWINPHPNNGLILAKDEIGDAPKPKGKLPFAVGDDHGGHPLEVTIRHELGHVLDFHYSTRLRDMRIEKFKNTHKFQGLSQYAKSDKFEGWAEAYAGLKYIPREKWTKDMHEMHGLLQELGHA